MRSIGNAAHRIEFEARIKLHGPLRRLECMRWDRELRKRKTSPCAPEDDATAILWRPIHSGLQDAEAHLIPITVGACSSWRWQTRGKTEEDVPKGRERTQDKFHNTVSNSASFLWSRLIDLEFVVQEAKYVLQEEELRLIELDVGQHIADQGVPAA